MSFFFPADSGNQRKAVVTRLGLGQMLKQVLKSSPVFLFTRLLEFVARVEVDVSCLETYQ